MPADLAGRGAVSAAEFSRLSGLSPSAVSDHLDSGLIPELARIGARRFIPADWVRAWLSTPVNLRTDLTPVP
jgi:predicted transcriptional regulator